MRMNAGTSPSTRGLRVRNRSGVAGALKPSVGHFKHRAPEVRSIRRRLLAWYDAHRRELPWRDTGDPYRVWLSEMMLQQTQVATVIPYFERFIARWSTVRDLAAAPLDDVLHAWAGLGYYARARNLHKAARMVVDAFGSVFPESVEELLKLPGVGRYSAGAIASIAFGKQASVVDGNVARVLARLFVLEEDVRSGAGRDAAWALADALVPAARPGDFNQAVMELGATVCLPGESARCLTCPLRGECGAAAAGRAAELPVRTRKTPVQKETHVVVAIECAKKWLMVRRPEGGLWGGLWEMPSAVANGRGLARCASQIIKDLKLKGVRLRDEPFLTFNHQLTHRAIEFVCYAGRVGNQRASLGGTLRWCSIDEIGALGVSRAMMRVVGALPGAAAAACE